MCSIVGQKKNGFTLSTGPIAQEEDLGADEPDVVEEEVLELVLDVEVDEVLVLPVLPAEPLEPPELPDEVALEGVDVLDAGEAWPSVPSPLESAEEEDVAREPSPAVLLAAPLSLVELTASALGLSPPLKSVTYQPEPLSWKPAAVTCFENCGSAHCKHTLRGGSESFCKTSLAKPQDAHL